MEARVVRGWRDCRGDLAVPAAAPRPRRRVTEPAGAYRAHHARNRVGGDMFEEVLPGGVGYAESFVATAEGHLYPEERSAMARAIDKRRRDFIAGRMCARRAMAQL